MMRKKIHLTAIMLTTGLAGLSFNQQTLHAEAVPPMTIEAETATPVPAIKAGETLTLARVVAITRQNQPAILAARKNVLTNESRVGQEKSQYYPQVDTDGSFSRMKSALLGIHLDSTYDYQSIGVSGRQMLYDFGKTSTRVKIQETTLDSARAELDTSDELSVFNTKIAYYDVLKAARNKEVAIETVKQFEQHLEQAKGFFAAGVKPKYDVTKAEVDLSSARLLLIQAENSLRLARVILNNTMGLPDAPDYQLEDNLTFTPFTLPFDQALPLALSYRPDLKALTLKHQAAVQTIDLARKGYAPSISGNAGTGYSGKTDTMNDEWNVGVAFTVPIFNGHLTRHQIGEAEANADVLAANITALRQTIHKQVEQNYLNLQEAEERIATTKLAIQQAEENSIIATGRYNAGVGNPVEVTDADTLLVQARASHIRALYDYRTAQTSIEQSIGRTPDFEPQALPE
jgi:outer membrane protein TolC